MRCTTLPLKVFTQRNFVADFLRELPYFLCGNEKKSLLRPPLGVRATYAVHLRFTGKLVVDFLLGAFVLSQSTRLTDRQTDGRTDGQTDRQMLIGRPRLRSCSAVKRNVKVLIVIIVLSAVKDIGRDHQMMADFCILYQVYVVM